MRYHGAVLCVKVAALLDAVVIPLGYAVEIGCRAVQMIGRGLFAEQESGARHTVPERECGYGKRTVVVDNCCLCRVESLELNLELQVTAVEIHLLAEHGAQLLGRVYIKRCGASQQSER